MNKIIKGELDKLRVPFIIDQSERNVYVMKDGKQVEFMLNTPYTITVRDNLFQKTGDFYKHVTWNSGKKFQDKTIVIEIVKFLADMVMFNGVGKETSTEYKNFWIQRSMIESVVVK